MYFEGLFIVEIGEKATHPSWLIVFTRLRKGMIGKGKGGNTGYIAMFESNVSFMGIPHKR